MPLDSGAYLKSLGWQGSGNGLRKDGMSKPLAIPQKRTLSGVGKDRDEAFPFWDHVFNAAANSIKIKIHNDDSDQSDVESEQSNMLEVTLSRTSTGIISNRRPASSTPIGSGSATPKDVPNKSRLSLLAQAKRQAAYARLYASFYKGPVITPLKDDYTINEAEEDKTKERDTHVDESQTNISSKDSKSCGIISPDSSRKRKKNSSKAKSDKTEIHLLEDSGQSSDEGKDKSTKKRHKKKRPAGMEVSSEQDLDNQKEPKRKKKRKSDTIDEEAEESTSKQKEGSKKKRRLEDRDDKRGKRKKSKSKTVDDSDNENTEEHILGLNDGIDKDEKRRDKKPKERKRARTN